MKTAPHFSRASQSRTAHRFGRWLCLALCCALPSGAHSQTQADAQSSAAYAPHEGRRAQADAQSSAAYAFREGLWFDAQRGIGYLMRPEGGVGAIDLATGLNLWTSDALQRPLLAGAQWLLGQREAEGRELSLALLRTDAAPQLLWTARTRLPEGVRAHLADARTEFFHLQACRLSPSELGVVWHFDEAPKPLRDDPDRARRVTGQLRIATDSGKVRESDARPCAPLALPANAAGNPAPGSITPSGATVRYPSADGRHYLASRASADGLSFEWEIYEPGTDAPVARLVQPQAAAWFVVRGELLIRDAASEVEAAPPSLAETSDSPIPARRLRAISLRSGVTLWSHAYRDTRYRGVAIPAAERTGEFQEED